MKNTNSNLEQTYKINLRNQINSIKKGFFFLVTTSLILAIFYYYGKIKGDEMLPIAVIMGLLNFFLFIPAFYLHVTYYICNYKTVLIVSMISKRFTVIKDGKTASYSFDEIKLAEQHLGIYYNYGGRMAPWTDYGYLKVKTNNGDLYYFSSLMLNIFKPPIPIRETLYSGLPIINKKEAPLSNDPGQVFKLDPEKVLQFKETFSKYSEESLLERINNPGKYTPEAITAAKELLALKSNNKT